MKKDKVVKVEAKIGCGGGYNSSSASNKSDEKAAPAKGHARLIGIDLCRIIFAFVVFMFHTTKNTNFDWGILQPLAKMGNVTLTGFFVLSGYILYSVYGKKDMSDFSSQKKFWTNRISSIYPSYLLLICVYFIINIFVDKTDVLKCFLHLPVELLGLQTVFYSLKDFSHNAGSWFVSCIIICYILYPFLHQIVSKMSDKANIVFLLGLVAILLYEPIVVHVFDIPSNYRNPFFRLLEFAAGTVMAGIISKLEVGGSAYKVFKSPIFSCALWGLLAVGVSAAVIFKIIPENAMLYSWIVLPIFLLLIPSMALVKFSFVQNSKVLQNVISYLSEISYAFYLS